MTLLEVQGLTKHFGATRALEDVSLGIAAGEIVGLIGPNGAGKTTLLECLAGVLPRDGGRITRSAPLFYVPDGIVPWEAHPVRWALQFMGRLHGADPSAPATVSAELGLAPLLDRPLGTLSRGQRKRVLLALGLVTPAPLLLFDEPFEGLDVRQARETAALLRAQTAPPRARTLFLSIHQLGDAERVCDRMVLLSGGRVLGAGTLAELQARAERPGAPLEDVFLALT